MFYFSLDFTHMIFPIFSVFIYFTPSFKYQKAQISQMPLFYIVVCTLWVTATHVTKQYNLMQAKRQ